jgi:hypothetical protein
VLLYVLARLIEVMSILLWTVQIIYNYPAINNQRIGFGSEPDYRRVRAAVVFYCCQQGIIFPPTKQKQSVNANNVYRSCQRNTRQRTKEKPIIIESVNFPSSRVLPMYSCQLGSFVNFHFIFTHQHPPTR